MDHIHYKRIQSHPEGLDQLEEIAKKLNTLPWASVNVASTVAPKRFTGFMEVIQTLKNFVCDRCGASFGSVLTWQADRAIVLDSVSGLNDIVMGSVAGNSITKSQPQYGTAQTQEMSIIHTLLQCKPHFICIGHLTRAADDTGNITVSTDLIGVKLGPGFPKIFGEVYMSYKDGIGFFWDANNGKVSTKSRIFSVQENLNKIKQDFGPIIQRWYALNMPIGLNILVHGDPGTGKSYAIGSLMRAGIEPFVLLTEGAELTYNMLDIRKGEKVPEIVLNKKSV